MLKYSIIALKFPIVHHRSCTGGTYAFRRIDEDNDGELSESEITYELYRDIQAINKNINEVSGSGIIIGILSFLNSKSSRKLVRNFGKLGLGITIFDLGYAICNKLLLNKMNQRIIQGYN